MCAAAYQEYPYLIDSDLVSKDIGRSWNDEFARPVDASTASHFRGLPQRFGCSKQATYGGVGRIRIVFCDEFRELFQTSSSPPDRHRPPLYLRAFRNQPRPSVMARQRSTGHGYFIARSAVADSVPVCQNP